MIAHVRVALAPFAISVSPWQQVWALGLGLYYAWVFHRTGSLLAPVLAHGYSNGIIFVVEYALAAMLPGTR
jgi:membrane protease YdiL (CAAX protease family)